MQQAAPQHGDHHAQLVAISSARTLGGSSLLAVGAVVPEFLANTACAADKVEKGKDTVLVVIEMTGGNDGLNTVVPYGDDLYHKARPTLALRQEGSPQARRLLRPAPAA